MRKNLNDKLDDLLRSWLAKADSLINEERNSNYYNTYASHWTNEQWIEHRKNQNRSLMLYECIQELKEALGKK